LDGRRPAWQIPGMTNPDALHPARRGLLLGAAACAVAGPARAAAASELAAIEAKAKARLGVFAMDSDGEMRLSHRADERFPTCSTFKLLLAGVVLARVDAGEERLDRMIAYRRGDLLSNSPVTEANMATGRLSVERLCQAVVEVSDNTGANLLLASVGGPAGFTARLRDLGDDVTRLDRTELALNEATPGDPRDTTTPRAMATTVRTLLLRNALMSSSRTRLATWMQGAKTGLTLLRSATPAGWRAGDKTGRGAHGSTNDVAVFWPPEGPPLIVAAYLTECQEEAAVREAALASVGRLAVKS
jgi:beta-lactamase class A